MNKFLILGLMVAFNAQVVFAEDAPATMPPMDEKMIVAMKLMEPSDGHRKLDALIGAFKAKTTMWMSADAPAEMTEGTSEAKWILGGRFVQQTFKSQFMGKPFEGIGIIGYDNIGEEYNSIWIDNMATGVMKSTGKYDEVTQSLTEEGTFSCPMTGKKNMAQRSITKIIDENRHVFEMWHDDVKTGKNYKAMEIVYERVV